MELLHLGGRKGPRSVCKGIPIRVRGTIPLTIISAPRWYIHITQKHQAAPAKYEPSYSILIT